MAIKVFIADDHAIVQDGLRAMLEENPDIEVIGLANDGQQAVVQAQNLQPDVLIMDISMPVLDGINACQQIREAAPQIRTIILSMLGTAEHIFRALQAGARGYMLKESAGREVMDAVQSVYAGDIYLSQPVINTLVADYIALYEQAQPKSTVDLLSQREREILSLVVEGKTSAEIAALIFLSPKTVETYRARLMKKLGVNDLSDLIKFAIQNGLIELE